MAWFCPLRPPYFSLGPLGPPGPDDLSLAPCFSFMVCSLRLFPSQAKAVRAEAFQLPILTFHWRGTGLAFPGGFPNTGSPITPTNPSRVQFLVCPGPLYQATLISSYFPRPYVEAYPFPLKRCPPAHKSSSILYSYHSKSYLGPSFLSTTPQVTPHITVMQAPMTLAFNSLQLSHYAETFCPS